MRRGVLASVLLALVLSATPAWAAAKPAKSAATPAKQVTWEAVAGVFKTHKAASNMIRRLDAKNLKGFAIETERAPRSRALRYEVERSFPKREEAQAEVTRLRSAHFRGQIERD